MKKEDIRLDDWQRILFGEAPPEFIIEAFFRTILIFIFLLFIVRLLGKRMSGQLTLTELAVMLSMGAIISPSMQMPDRGVLVGILAMLCILGFQRGITLLGFRNSTIETITQGGGDVLVKDGILQLKEMAATRVTHQQLFAALRGKKIYNLSRVKRVYLEAAGMFSIYEDQETRPGLSVLPPDDEGVRRLHQGVDDQSACKNCGKTVPRADNAKPCPVCGLQDWTFAVL